MRDTAATLLVLASALTGPPETKGQLLDGLKRMRGAAHLDDEVHKATGYSEHTVKRVMADFPQGKVREPTWGKGRPKGSFRLGRTKWIKIGRGTGCMRRSTGAR